MLECERALVQQHRQSVGGLAAEASGLAPIKINAVAMKGVNDDELLNLARLSLEHPWHIRFIELMPIKNQAPRQAMISLLFERFSILLVVTRKSEKSSISAMRPTPSR